MPISGRSLPRRCALLFVVALGGALGSLGLYLLFSTVIPIPPETRDQFLRALGCNASFASSLDRRRSAHRVVPSPGTRGPRRTRRVGPQWSTHDGNGRGDRAPPADLDPPLPDLAVVPGYRSIRRLGAILAGGPGAVSRSPRLRLPRADLPALPGRGPPFGWGHTALYYAIDAAFLIGFGVALAAWSRRLFGQSLAGLVSYLTFLCAYLGFDYVMVAQRDWHGPLFAVLGLMALEAMPGRVGRLVSALSMAIALLFRPQVVLFFARDDRRDR